MDKNKYQYLEQVFTDLQQIWTNCKTYNVSGSEIFRLAETMERKAKKLVKELKQALNIDTAGDGGHNLDDGGDGDGMDDDEHVEGGFGSKKSRVSGAAAGADEEDEDFGFDPERYVPFDEKVELAELMKRATKEGLTQVMNYLLEKQPEAVEDYGNDRLQVKIDVIEKEVFGYCKDLLANNVKEQPQKKQKTK